VSWTIFYWAIINLIKKNLDDSEIVVELAVIRGICQISQISDRLYGWLSEVVDTACDLRRDIRVMFIFFIHLT
jgi:hypothetical protein